MFDKPIYLENEYIYNTLMGRKAMQRWFMTTYEALTKYNTLRYDNTVFDIYEMMHLNGFMIKVIKRRKLEASIKTTTSNTNLTVKLYLPSL